MKTRFLSTSQLVSASAAAAVLCILSNAQAQTLVADYTFNNNLNSSVAGAPALTAVDPLSSSGFGTANVFGQNQTVYNFVGNASPPSDQAGLSLDTTGLISANNYSVQMAVSLDDINGWRRLIDVENRTSDDGLYYDPSHVLDVYPVAGGGSAVTANTFEDVVMTVAPDNTVDLYLNNTLAFQTTTTVMDIANAGNLINFFLDNTAGGGQGEFSSGSVADIQIYSGVLSADQVVADSLLPTPDGGSTLALLGLGSAALTVLRRKLA
jgi:hypothetical protein